MIVRRVLVDAGPLVAVFSRNDANREICISASKGFEVPLLTSWPVVTETAWLLRNYPIGIRDVFQSVEDGFLKIVDLDDGFIKWGRAFLERYENIGAQLADASLVYLAEREKIDNVFTLDRRDFSIYRTTRNRALTILPE